MSALRRAVFLLAAVSLWFAPLSWGQDEAARSALQSADQQAQSSLNTVNQARQNYLAAVQKSGATSPEALAAQTHLEAARKTWRAKLTSRRQLRQKARGEMIRRHAE